MADICPFPTIANDEAVKRLTIKLMAAFEAGEDLGSRAPHIHALAETLERTLTNLDREVQGLRATLLPNEADMLLRDCNLEVLRVQLKRLISGARSLSGSELHKDASSMKLK